MNALNTANAQWPARRSLVPLLVLTLDWLT